MVHPFHPEHGREYELVGFAPTWGEQRVFFREPGGTRIRSMPAAWTDVEGPDPYLVVSAGRSNFRVDDLLTLAALVAELSRGACKGDYAAHDRQITPGTSSCPQVKAPTRRQSRIQKRDEHNLE